MRDMQVARTYSRAVQGDFTSLKIPVRTGVNLNQQGAFPFELADEPAPK